MHGIYFQTKSCALFDLFKCNTIHFQIAGIFFGDVFTLQTHVFHQNEWLQINSHWLIYPSYTFLCNNFLDNLLYFNISKQADHQWMLKDLLQRRKRGETRAHIQRKTCACFLYIGKHSEGNHAGKKDRNHEHTG